ncbi:MAG: adenosine deaminase [Actinobacteria bacterium]|nr:adenosine deaminase [Actinomycetota bacterium]
MTDYRAIPKISLHDHLDGGLRPETIVEISDAIGHKLPADNAKDLNQWFLDSCDSGSLVRYLETFEHTIAVMQSEENLARVAYEFALDLAKDGVIYGEIRWAPEQHLRNGLSLDQAVEAVEAGLAKARKEVRAEGGYLATGQLITAMRQNDKAQEIAELTVRHRNKGVVGFDYAGPEDGFSPTRHAGAFAWLNEQLMPVTLHAGEAAGRDSIRAAIVDGRTLRLGHGVRIIEDVFVDENDDNKYGFGEVATWVLERGIALELSPSSNLQTGAIPGIENPTMRDHPVVMSALNDALGQNAIQLAVSASTWSEAITLAGNGLELSGRSTSEYTRAMISAFEELGPYMVIAPGIALAHARPSSEVLSTGLSLVVLESSVEFGSERFDPVRIVFGLAAIDHDGHIDLMAGLSELLLDETKVNMLLQSDNESEVRRLLG